MLANLGCSPSFTPLFAVDQNFLSLFYVQQVEGQMGGNIAEHRSHERPLIQIVINSFRVGIHYVVRQSHLDYSIDFGSFVI